MRSKGFTVLELLVVVAMICILAAILFPVFLQSKLTAYRTSCASNMKQLYKAFSMYEGDWDGYWPCPGGLIGNYSYWTQSANGGLESYVNQRGLKTVWCCPLLTEWNGKYPARTYTMNSYLRTPCDKEYPGCIYLISGIDTVNIQEPTKTILLFEGMALTVANCESSLEYNYIYRCANWSRVAGYYELARYTTTAGRPWHGMTNNYLYCDGHVKARRPGTKTNGTLSTWEEMQEWYVDKDYFYSIYGTGPS